MAIQSFAEVGGPARMLEHYETTERVPVVHLLRPDGTIAVVPTNSSPDPVVAMLTAVGFNPPVIEYVGMSDAISMTMSYDEAADLSTSGMTPADLIMMGDERFAIEAVAFWGRPGHEPEMWHKATGQPAVRHSADEFPPNSLGVIRALPLPWLVQDYVNATRSQSAWMN
jgi:hypothetical protein